MGDSFGREVLTEPASEAQPVLLSYESSRGIVIVVANLQRPSRVGGLAGVAGSLVLSAKLSKSVASAARRSPERGAEPWGG